MSIVRAIFLYILIFELATNALRPICVYADGNQTTPKVRISGKIMQSRLVHRVPPDYPQEAREKGIEGTVSLEILVGPNGTIGQIEVISGNPVLTKAAIDAVRQWKYDPTYIKGQAVSVITRVDVSFRSRSMRRIHLRIASAARVVHHCAAPVNVN